MIKKRGMRICKLRILASAVAVETLLTPDDWLDSIAAECSPAISKAQFQVGMRYYFDCSVDFQLET